MSMILYLIVTLAGHELSWGPGAEPPESGVLGVSDEHILNLICDTGRSRISVGSRGRSPRKFRGFGQ